jgi:fatty-acyl-CoA synthase
LVPVNTNYRYGDDELSYLWSNADAVAVVFHGTFVGRIERIRERVPDVRSWLWVDDGSGPCPDWAIPYEEAAKSATARVAAPWGRSGDDLLMIYTGGTTGMPKGVMWRQDDLFARLIAGGLRQYDVDGGIDAVRQSLIANPGASTLLPACPLMHGTGFMTALVALLSGGTIVTVDNVNFDPHAIWAAVEKNRVSGMAIVGDPFAKPLLRALDETPGRYDLASLMSITSSGAMWSVEVKRGLIKHAQQLTLTDSFASTEAMGMGNSIMTKDGEMQTAAFTLMENSIVIDEHDKPIPPGSGKAGLVALAGPLPAGYYKDAEKTARTFRTIGNVRYSIPGDFARVEADGTITLLGRGSNCINTAGEKVYPEEVEEALKTHPAVEDALVLGVPDDIWGQAVTGVVKLANGMEFDEASLREHVRAKLAGYKTPKRIVEATIPLRAPNGKADYKSASDFAKRSLGLTG